MGVKQQRVKRINQERRDHSVIWKTCSGTTKSVETETIDQPKSTNSNAMSEETVVKVMGVMWDKSEDCFKFDLSAFSKQTLSGTLTNENC